jgi:hypothetical protein
MTRTAQLTSRLVQHLGLAQNDFVVRDAPARAALVAEVHAGYFRGHRYTDVGDSGFGLYEIVDDGCGSFENRRVDSAN